MRKLQTHLAFTCCLLQGPRCSGQQIPIKAVDVEGHCTGRQPAIEFSLADRICASQHRFHPKGQCPAYIFRVKRIRIDRPTFFYFWQRFLSSGTRTADPDKADLFFIPLPFLLSDGKCADEVQICITAAVSIAEVHLNCAATILMISAFRVGSYAGLGGSHTRFYACQYAYVAYVPEGVS
eukprot:1161130-Pelagomonas_calceolata.AAC.4